MNKTKLPLAITTSFDIRDKSENYLYIDKTDFAHRKDRKFNGVFQSIS
ncbi:MAG: hypothetical protein KZQ83_09510 [gamma proteobacterium symbiont of Taylorina sp.]|nr:hypothetical protein [gamma proteobacterium symbiont of Taylorina sp.]